jgi:hypothetical protein
MILHYASLAADAGGVDAFLIGSELKSLTRVRSASGVYPAVNALVTLAADVKAIVGSGTVVTYGADWTEYGAHVVDSSAHEVRFPLDALWASSSIDAVGIDYYAPLADWRDDGYQLVLTLTDSPYRLDYLAGNLARGEAMTGTTPMTPRAPRRRVRRSATGSANRGFSDKRICGVSGSKPITSVSPAPSCPVTPPGCRKANRSG